MVELDIRALPGLFSWQDSARLEAITLELGRRHKGFIASRIAAHAVAGGDPDPGPVVGALTRLPPGAMAAILGAPETCHSVYRSEDAGTDQLWRFLAASVEAEEMRLGLRARGGDGVWSATGDCYFGSAADGAADLDNPRFGGIVCDMTSPFSKTEIVASKFKPDFGPGEPFSRKETEEVLFKCFAACQCLMSATPSVWSFVEGMIQTLMPRKDPVNATFKGSSNRGIIGRSNLINPHLDVVDHTVVANSLIHESIHIALYYFEEIEGLFTSEDVAFDGRILSPWSGNLINPRAYLHGFFVWYALYRYWLSVDPGRAGFAPDVGAHFLEFCANGFRADAALTGIMEFKEFVRPDVWAALEDMQARVSALLAADPSIVGVRAVRRGELAG